MLLFSVEHNSIMNELTSSFSVAVICLKPEEDRAREEKQKFEGGEAARDSTFCRGERKPWTL